MWTYIILFLEFFKIGLFSVGGGLATLPFLYELANKYPWLTTNDIADMIAVSESTPGPIGVNMSTYSGFQGGGLIGGIIATTGLVAPSIIIIIIIAQILKKFKESEYVDSAFYGLRPAVTGLIAAAGYQVFRVSILSLDIFEKNKSLLKLFNLKATFLLLILLGLMKFTKKHPVIYILIGAIAGIIFKL